MPASNDALARHRPSVAMPTSIPTKTLYRRIDALFSELHATEQGEAFVARVLTGLFDACRVEFGLIAAAAFARTGNTLEPLASVGPASTPAPPVPETLHLLLVQLPSSTETGAESRSAHFTVETSRRPCTLVFTFAKSSDWPSVEVLLNTAASILAVRLLEERLGNTLREAAEIQRSLLPEGPPSFPGYEIAARSVSASEVGGDWYDFLPLGEGALGIAIGDASGHGLPAALMARDVVIGLRMGMEREFKAGYVLSKLNRVIHASSLSSRFVSLFYGELEENGSLFYYNAGHGLALVVGDAETRGLPSGDPVLGPLPEVRFRRRFEHLDHGALLALYTDGIIERRNGDGELFGAARLQRLLETHRHRPAMQILTSCFDELDDFGAIHTDKDDATLVLVRRLPS